MIAPLLEQTGESDPEVAIRKVARELITAFHQAFGEDPPFDMGALASFRGIRIVDEPPRHSEDAELAPTDDGSVVIRLNRERPPTRQRFSIAHEIAHTLLPGYQLEVRRRKGIDGYPEDPERLIENLCDVAASEFLLPLPWFLHDMPSVSSADELVALSQKYEASRDATVRRFVDVAQEPTAAVFLEWSLKPTQQRQLEADRNQQFMFEIDPAVEADQSRALRVDYVVDNPAFRQAHQGRRIPRHKSVADTSVPGQAADANTCVSGVGYIDFGSIAGSYEIWAIPLYTHLRALGPAGQARIAAIIRAPRRHSG